MMEISDLQLMKSAVSILLNLDRSFIDKIYGEGVVNSEEEFMKKIEEEISANLKRESDYQTDD